MQDWILWTTLAVALTILEMFTGTFYLLMIALGRAAGALVAAAGAGHPVQFLVAAAVGVAAVGGLRSRRLARQRPADAAHDPNINIDIGQTIQVIAWQTTDGKAYTARAMYRGAPWDVQLDRGGIAEPGAFIIREVRGSRLFVTNFTD
ncbi:MAG: NfeD family protein [Burkholderiaceae bacterium]